MNAKSDYIAVFDSGVGGISVLRHLINTMPGERYLYFGDSANAPYGSRTTQEVQALTLTAIENLMAQYPIKAVVVACNTATAAAIRLLRHTYPKLIIIGIEPALKVAADHFPGGRIGVMATDVTLREEKFDSLLHRFDEECTITKIPAPGLVPLIEAGKVEGPEVVLLDGGSGTARETKRRLTQADLLEEGSGEIRILNSADDPHMIALSYERLKQER